MMDFFAFLDAVEIMDECSLSSRCFEYVMRNLDGEFAVQKALVEKGFVVSDGLKAGARWAVYEG